VKNYYTQLASLMRIQRIFVLTENPTSTAKPRILGVIPAVFSPQLDTAAWNDPEILYQTLLAPTNVGLMTFANLKEFRTKEYERDDSSKKMIAVKGSIENSPHASMYEHLEALLRAGKLHDRTPDIRPKKAEGKGIKDKKVKIESKQYPSQSSIFATFERFDADAMQFLRFLLDLVGKPIHLLHQQS
jgi:hypothetical protein